MDWRISRKRVGLDLGMAGFTDRRQTSAPSVYGVTVLQQWTQAILITLWQTMKNVGSGTIID